MTTAAQAGLAPRFIEELSIAGYGCVTNATFRLSPLHAFVGPSDSGKSTLLRAVHTLLVAGSAEQGEGTQLLDGGDPRWPKAGEARLMLRLAEHSTTYEVARCEQSNVERLVRSKATLEIELVRRDQTSVLRALPFHVIAQVRLGNLAVTDPVHGPQSRPQGSVMILDPKADASVFASGTVGRLETLDHEAHELSDWITPPACLCFDADALRMPSTLIPRGAPVRFQDERGTGLPGVLEAIRDRSEANWAALRERFLSVFPVAKKLRLTSISETQKSVEVELPDGRRFGVDVMSEGMLRFLGYLAAAYADRVSVLLVENPENGVHPSRIGELMMMLRELSTLEQILITTHSPLVVNELHGDEVTVVVRDDEQGTRGTLLLETNDYDKRSKVYAPGELWMSYANGTDEAPLLKGSARK